MTTAALIDLIINYTDNVSASDGDNAGRRLRMLQWAQEVFDMVYTHKEWRFRLVTSDVTLVTGFVQLPSDFHDFGDEGGVFNPRGDKMIEVNPRELNRMRESGMSDSSLLYYSVYGFDATSGRPKIIVVDATSTQVLTVWYLKTPPTLVDTTGATNNLFHIPLAYHNTVLVPGVVAKTRKSKGDTRDWASDFQRGLQEMIKNDRPKKTSVQRVPKAINGQW